MIEEIFSFQKVFSIKYLVCQSGCKSLLNFTWNTKKFLNCLNANSLKCHHGTQHLSCSFVKKSQVLISSFLTYWLLHRGVSPMPKKSNIRKRRLLFKDHISLFYFGRWKGTIEWILELLLWLWYDQEFICFSNNWHKKRWTVRVSQGIQKLYFYCH